MASSFCEYPDTFEGPEQAIINGLDKCRPRKDAPNKTTALCYQEHAIYIEALMPGAKKLQFPLEETLKEVAMTAPLDGGGW